MVNIHQKVFNIIFFFFQEFTLQICATMYSENSMSQQSGKQPTLNAKLDLYDDRTKRTYFVTENGEKKQKIENEVKNLIPNMAKCIGGIKVNLNECYNYSVISKILILQLKELEIQLIFLNSRWSFVMTLHTISMSLRWYSKSILKLRKMCINNSMDN